jgi:hypothetical protein
MKKYVLGQKKILKDRDGIGETEIKRRETDKQTDRNKKKREREK